MHFFVQPIFAVAFLFNHDLFPDCSPTVAYFADFINLRPLFDAIPVTQVSGFKIAVFE